MEKINFWGALDGLMNGYVQLEVAKTQAEINAAGTTTATPEKVIEASTTQQESGAQPAQSNNTILIVGGLVVAAMAMFMLAKS